MLAKPDVYKKSIHDIDYERLRQEGIKCLVFDLDNTLGLIDEVNCPELSKKLLQQLKKKFIVYISSNNTGRRLQPYLEALDVRGIAWSFKPLPRGLRKIERETGVKNVEMAMIGDQVITDVISGNLNGSKTILVDPLGDKDLKITGINRKIERVLVKKMEKKGVFQKGQYYE